MRTSGRQFSVYRHNFVVKDSTLIGRQFVVIRDAEGKLQFTDFHRYINSAYNVRKITDDGNNRFRFIIQLLNYVFFHCGLEKLEDISVELVKEFLNDYGMCDLPWDDENTSRSKDTVNRCVATVMDFLTALIEDPKTECKIKVKDLYRMVNKRDKKGHVYQVKEPVFEVRYLGRFKSPIFRDMPNRAFQLLLEHIIYQHTDILGLVINSAFGGLRPSEACNVRRPDSPLGPGIIFHKVGGEVYKIEIDLREELNLRSDFLPVGRIKKERMQVIPDIFFDAYVDLYNIYMEHLAGRKYEQEYGPFTVNKQGKAMIYDTYRQRFRAIIDDEMVPIYLADSDPEVVRFGRMLLEHKLSPHVFRHWYTVQLVLSGVEHEDLMHMRGDKSPESALAYIKDKSELVRQYRRVNNGIFDYIRWAAQKAKEKESE